MDFFSAQDNARKKTKYLILIYVLVLVLLTFVTTLILLLLIPVTFGKPLPEPFWLALFSTQYLPTLLGVGAFIMGGALFSSYLKSRHLSKGGSVVAASLGGVKISPNTTDLNERKVLNVVEEMAIASGMPVPDVYLLKNESTINAFAAGQTPMDAVIGVTKGCVNKLTRTQLQGVIGHEFSHILNGDMRLNLRIIMLLHGIEFIGVLGRILTSSQRHSRYSSSRSRNKSGGGIILAGIALRIIGWIGVLFGNLIQAAVSRQREFLADASSVQFTRDPSAISGALKVIGGVSESSKIRHTDVKEAAHMFFGQAFNTRLSFLFATHPPIDLRIKSIEPGWDGQFLKPLPAVEISEAEPVPEESSVASSPIAGLPEPLVTLLAAGVILEQLSEKQQQRLANLVEEAADSLEAMAIVVAILIDGNQTLEEINWQQAFKDIEIKGLQELVEKQLNQLNEVELENELPLIELSMPALKQMSLQQYAEYKKLLQAVMLLDNQKTIFEESIFQLVTRYLDVHFGLKSATKVKFIKASQVEMEIQLVLSMLVHFGHDSNSIAKSTMQNAFKRAVNHIGLPNLEMIDIEDSHHELFNGASEKLVYCSLPLKQKISQALTICIEHDGEIKPIEKELALAIAATMDAPIPRMT
jgi:Zn-dependent protease with chaperone function